MREKTVTPVRSSRSSAFARLNLSAALFIALFALSLVGCSKNQQDEKPTAPVTTETETEAAAITTTPKPSAIRVGFVAVGPEGAWRSANEENIRNTFTAENGFDLIYSPAKSLDQQSQVAAMRGFIDEPVDVILLSCTDATGWDEILREAKAKSIPVVLIDRGIEPNNASLYATRIAPDNFEISRQVGEWAVREFPAGAKYFVLEGPPGVSVVTERNFGWNAVIASNPKFVSLGAATARWSLDEGRKVFSEVLRKEKNNVQLVFAQNDEMGLGAALAVKDAGLTPGVDVKIATIDGTRSALEALARNELSFVAEYQPMFGDVALNAVRQVLAGSDVLPYITVPGKVFSSPDEAKEALPTRKF